MIINHNIAALNTYRQLSANNTTGQKSLEKLSSGLRINRAGDDAAGLAISEKMRAQIRGLDQATRNAQDGISMIQTAEGALNETHSILQRMRELAVQASSDTNTIVDRKEIQKELNQLLDEIDRIADNTEFNTKKLINGDLAVAEAAGEATGPMITGSDASGNFNTNMDTTLTVDSFELNGETVDLTSVIALDGSGTPFDIDALVGALQTDIDAVFSSDVTFTVGHDGDALTITSSETAEGSEITITANADTAALGLTADEFTDATATVEAAAAGGTGAIIHIGANQGQNLSISISSMRTDAIGGGGTEEEGEATGPMITGSDASGNFNTNMDTTLTVDSFELNGETVDLTSVIALDGSGTPFDIDALVGALQTDIDAVFSSDVTFTVGHDGDALTITSSETAEGSEITITANADTAALGLTADDHTDATATVEAAAGGTISALRVADADIEAVTSDAAAAELENSGVLTQAGADAAITNIQAAIEQVSAQRSKMGAYQNRLEHTINNLGTSSENLTAAESRIRDVDMAKEMMEFTKMNILSQAAQAMLAQANQQPQSVLQLLG